MVAYFFFSDGYNTISNVGVTFAQQELGVTFTSLAIAGILSPTCAIIGIWFYRFVQVKLELSSGKLVSFLVCCMMVFPIYMCLGFIPGSRNIPIGFWTTGEMYILISWYGFNLGAIQSYAVSISQIFFVVKCRH